MEAVVMIRVVAGLLCLVWFGIVFFITRKYGALPEDEMLFYEGEVYQGKEGKGDYDR